MEFQIGDVVKFYNTGEEWTCTDVNKWELTDLGSSGSYKGRVHNGSLDYYVNSKQARIIKTNKKTMTSLKQKFNNLFTQEPQKSFRKAGITDDSDILTDEGRAVFLAWLLGKNADAFKAEVVDPILAEEAKENK